MQTPLISVSGVRGIVGETFTDDLVRRWCTAFAHHIQQSPLSMHPSVVLGRDTRQSGKKALEVAVNAFIECGVRSVVVDVAPTPTIARAVPYHKAGGGLIITGSHNPSEWNALKFVGADGIFLPAKDMENLTRLANYNPHNAQKKIMHDAVVVDHDAVIRHVRAICSSPIIKEIPSCHFRTAADPVNGTGAVAIPILLNALSVKEKYINNEPNGIFAHNPEPRAEHLTALGDTVRKNHCDIGFATDPDADRLALVDEHGTPISEEYTVALSVLSVLSSLQKHSPVAVNLSTTRMVDDIAAMFGSRVIRTAVGERHVVDGMVDANAVIGGEGNGGVIYLPSHPGRDALVGITLILSLMARTGKSLSELVSNIPSYKMRKEKISCNQSSGQQYDINTIQQRILTAFPKSSISTIDGIRADTPDGWVHIRPSNTEPVLRLIGEARTKKQLDDLFTVATLQSEQDVTQTQHPH